jgi:Na+-driven multidrug efflux pump
VKTCLKLGALAPPDSSKKNIFGIPVCFVSGVAVGAGWQVPVAFINVGCYYLVGIPMGILFGFKLKHGTTVN